MPLLADVLGRPLGNETLSRIAKVSSVELGRRSTCPAEVPSDVWAVWPLPVTGPTSVAPTHGGHSQNMTRVGAMFTVWGGSLFFLHVMV